MIKKLLIVPILFLSSIASAADTNRVFSELFKATSAFSVSQTTVKRAQLLQLIGKIHPDKFATLSKPAQDLSTIITQNMNKLTDADNKSPITTADIQSQIQAGINDYVGTIIKNISDAGRNQAAIKSNFRNLVEVLKNLATAAPKDSSAFNSAIVNETLQTSIDNLKTSYNDNLTLKNYIQETSGLETVRQFFNFVKDFVFGTDHSKNIAQLELALQDADPAKKLSDLQDILSNEPSTDDINRAAADTKFGTGSTTGSQGTGTQDDMPKDTTTDTDTGDESPRFEEPSAFGE